MENEQNIQYPPKPEDNKGKRNRSTSLFSVVLFMGLFFIVTGGSVDAMIVVLIILLIHEVGHLTAMRIFKFKDESIFFLPFLGAALSYEHDHLSQKKKVITLLAGPVPGIIIGISLLAYATSIGHDTLLFVGQAFLFVNMFNLLPFDPLDGGKLVDTLFQKKSELIKLIFLFIAMLLFLFAAYYDTMMIIMSLLLGIRVNAIFKKRKLRTKLVEELDFDLNKSYNEVSDREYWEVRRFLLIQIPNNPIDPDRFEPFANENILVNKVKSIVLNPIKNKMSLGLRVLLFVLWLGSLVLPLWYILANTEMFGA